MKNFILLLALIITAITFPTKEVDDVKNPNRLVVIDYTCNAGSCVELGRREIKGRRAIAEYQGK